MDRRGAAYRPYLKWIHEIASYGAWKPSLQRLEPGDIGYFDRHKRFYARPDQTLKKFGIDGVEVSGDQTVNPSTEGSERDFTIAVDGRAAVPFGVHAVTVDAGGRITLRANRSWACILQLRQVTQNRITNPTAVAEKIRQRLIEGNWRVDLCVVTERTECIDGFAHISSRAGREITLVAKSKVSLSKIADLVDVSLVPSYESSQASSFDFPFTDCEVRATPLFVPGICVDRKLWVKLLRLRKPKRGTFLVDQSGRPWFDGQPPANLSHLTNAQAVYQEGAPGVLTPEQLERMPLDELIGPYEPPPEVGTSSDNARAALYLAGNWTRQQLGKTRSGKTKEPTREETPAP